MSNEEKVSSMLEKLKKAGHNPTYVQDGTYKCPQCGRYVVLTVGENFFTATGAMLKGKCSGTIRK